MKKTFVAVVLCMALLSSFTVFASAEFTSSDSTTLSNVYTQLTDIRNELGYPGGGYSSLRQAINYIADHLPSSPKDYSSVLSNIKSNSDSLVSYIKLIEGDTNSITARCTELVNLLNTVNSSIGTAQIAITNHIDSFATQNHSDISRFFSSLNVQNSPTDDTPFLLGGSTVTNSFVYGNFSSVLSMISGQLSSDFTPFTPLGFQPTIYHMIHQLQQVLASDDDLALKNDNKANEDAATDAFVNGNTSKTSLGTGDIGNLKDVGGTFNDLTSLNGQSSVSSFLSGLSSADGSGLGWFSEATRASLDAVSTPVTTTNLIYKTWRGEKALVASVSGDSSVNLVDSLASSADSDPFNMSGFEDNYNTGTANSNKTDKLNKRIRKPDKNKRKGIKKGQNRVSHEASPHNHL